MGAWVDAADIETDDLHGRPFASFDSQGTRLKGRIMARSDDQDPVWPIGIEIEGGMQKDGQIVRPQSFQTCRKWLDARIVRVGPKEE